MRNWGENPHSKSDLILPVFTLDPPSPDLENLHSRGTPILAVFTLDFPSPDLENLDSRGISVPFPTGSSANIRSSENQTLLTGTASNIITNPVNQSSTSNLSKSTIDNKKDSSKKFPPEIL